tara:strand:+ start:59 stop:439 length:381 start_codon:yes stop_codon:yes gene_type:complete
MSGSMAKKQTKEEKEKEVFEFMFETTILYWLDMLPLEYSKKMIETSKHKEFNWYYALNEKFKSNEGYQRSETMSPTMIKYFLIDFIEEKKWKPTMGFSDIMFKKMFKKIKELKERDEAYFMQECFM